MSKISKIRECWIPPVEHSNRQLLYSASGDLLEGSVKTRLEYLDETEYDIQHMQFPLLDVIRERHEFATSDDPRWKDKPFGAVNTVEKAGCLAFTAYNMLYLLGLEQYASMEELLDTIVQKGYRVWKFENCKEYLSWPKITLSQIKKKYATREVKKCTSLEEVYQILGKPVGIGGYMYFLDELIALEADVKPYEDTRLWTVQEMLENLKAGYPVPIRVGNATYRNDETLKGGHYVILVGFRNGRAVTVDNAVIGGIYECPIEQFFKAVIEDKKKVSGWNTSDMPKII